MKKVLSFIILFALVFSFAGCDSTTTNDDANILSDITSNFSEYNIDYSDAKSFESALNDGIKVKGKIVRFDVIEYKPNSAMGINCWSGEHLNFISETELDVEKGDVVIMDNMRSHHAKIVTELLDKAGISYLYLPPYSPDLNPIEKMWSKMKSFLRKRKVRVAAELPEAVKAALETIRTNDCKGWFHASVI